MKYKAVVFDLDGTLIDSLFELGSITNIVLRDNGFPIHPIDRYKIFVGDGAKALISRAIPESHRNETIINKCLNEFLTIYKKKCGDTVTLYPGIAELLNTLEMENIKLSILSNKPHELTLKNIGLLLPATRFEHVLGERDGIPKKPDPAGALEISKILHIAPSDFLYLGDTGVDMSTAIAAGMNPIGVLWGFRGEEELLNHGAKHLIKHPSELLSMIK